MKQLTQHNLQKRLKRELNIPILGFVDADYAHDGWQAGWNPYAWSAGIPDDSALAVSGGRDIAVERCSFSLLGGGGVRATNGSCGVRVKDSSFHRIGQSAVMRTGNATTQPRRCEVVGNVIETLGTQLASSAGVHWKKGCAAPTSTVPTITNA